VQLTAAAVCCAASASNGRPALTGVSAAGLPSPGRHVMRQQAATLGGNGSSAAVHLIARSQQQHHSWSYLTAALACNVVSGLAGAPGLFHSKSGAHVIRPTAQLI
jgi:hypothetical protein